jgi:ribosomal protein S18 acetylase RimI-like enzyme
MNIEVTDSPNTDDEAFVIAQVYAHNAAFVKKDVRRLCVFARSPDGTIIGGLTGKTYWHYLEVSFLWVSEAHRNLGHATKLLLAAEAEAVRRGCQHVLLDTYSFQALPFYRKLEYREFGRLSGFDGEHDRHYLHKDL